MSRRNDVKFTLIELLTVLAIIMILLSILLPSLKKARESGKRSVCLNNHKQLGLLLRGYCDDNDEWWIYPDKANASHGNHFRWGRVLVREGYASADPYYGEDYYLDFHCPALKAAGPVDNLVREPGDYIINGVYYRSESMPGLIYGGGLDSPTSRSTGCRDTQISSHSKFCVIMDRRDTQGIQPNDYLYSFSDLKTSGFAVNFFSHFNGANYSFADAHAEWKSWKDVEWPMFRLHESTMDHVKVDPSAVR